MEEKLSKLTVMQDKKFREIKNLESFFNLLFHTFAFCPEKDSSPVKTITSKSSAFYATVVFAFENCFRKMTSREDICKLKNYCLAIKKCGEEAGSIQLMQRDLSNPVPKSKVTVPGNTTKKNREYMNFVTEV
jgi:hypothetical protein